MDRQLAFEFAQSLGNLFWFENNTIMSIFIQFYHLRAHKAGRPLAVSMYVYDLSKLIYLYRDAIDLRQTCQSS